MHITFLFLTNVVLTLATDAPWASNHRFNKDQQLLLKGRHDTKPMIKTKGDKSMVDKHVKHLREESIDPWNLSENSDRIQFQIEGHEGPQTYIFGFDTGYGKNRQYRLEERHQDGTIKGQYGYYDANGKLRRVQYIAKPFEGYTEIHHENNMRKTEN